MMLANYNAVEWDNNLRLTKNRKTMKQSETIDIPNTPLIS
jgi:hypothetical protein